MKFIGDLMDYAVSNGASIRKLENSFSTIKEAKYVNYDALVNTLNHIHQELHDEYLGLHIGAQISLKAAAEVDSIMMNSQSLEKSIVNAINYSKLISDALECSLTKTEDYYSVIYEENPNWKVQQNYAKRQVLDMALISNVKSLAAYTNFHYQPIQVHFGYQKPKKLNEYYRLFNCSLKFNQSKTQIYYERHIIDRHHKNLHPGLVEDLKKKVAGEIAALPSENPLIYQLKKCILNHKPERVLLDKAALNLNLSSRSLQRKLKEFNTSFKRVEHDLQLKLAKTYLEEAQMSIDEISYLLGFSESSAFIRFFKSLTSKTPKEYQVNCK